MGHHNFMKSFLCCWLGFFWTDIKQSEKAIRKQNYEKRFVDFIQDMQLILKPS